MEWITTNIRFPEDVYMELRMEAARRKVSVASIVRERVDRKNKPGNKNTEKIMKELDKLARENDKYMKGKSLSKLLIEMRYEQ